MRVFLVILFRCVLALGLGFVPVANAFEMAAMHVSQDQVPQVPPCHAPSQDTGQDSGPCCGGAHCHCALANALPAALPLTHPILQASDHPQTVRFLAIEQSVSPDTPPPRA